MNRLSFTDVTVTEVKLDGKVVGTIKQVNVSKVESFVKIGWQYFPKGKGMGGEIFETKGECMHSLYDMD
jgi:hypothetical protein